MTGLGLSCETLTVVRTTGAGVGVGAECSVVGFFFRLWASLLLIL